MEQGVDFPGGSTLGIGINIHRPLWAGDRDSSLCPHREIVGHSDYCVRLCFDADQIEVSTSSITYGHIGYIRMLTREPLLAFFHFFRFEYSLPQSWRDSVIWSICSLRMAWHL